MKTFVVFLCVLMLQFVHRTALGQMVNGDFESRNSAPRGSNNIQGPGAAYDDLPNWVSVKRVTGTSCDYWAPGGVSFLNPQSSPYGSFSARDGNACVGILREPGSYLYDAGVAQQVALQPGRYYRAEFHAMRQPLSKFAERITLSLVNSPTAPTYSQSGYPTTLVPAPVATVESVPIGDPLQWIPVSGTFQVPPTPNATWWVVIGYKQGELADLPPYNPQLPSLPGGGASYYMIDGVTLTETCPPSSGSASRLELATDFGPMPDPRNPSVPNNYDDYCFSQRFTFTVPPGVEEGATGYQWIVNGYDVSNPGEVAGYTENGGTMSFTPISTYPGRYRNVNVTCVVSYGSGCQSAGSYRSLTVSSQDENGNYCVQYRGPQPAPTAAYPNPAEDYLTLSEKAETIELLNRSGKVVVSKQNQPAASQLDVRSLPEGLYMLRVVRNGKPTTQRIQIKH